MLASAAPHDIDALYAAHSAWLRGWLGQRTRCSDRAADLTQDTFCKLIESRPTDAPRDPRPYLATIARRLLIDDVRRAKVERLFLESYETLGDSDSAPSPERIVSAVEELMSVVRALDALPDRVRRGYLLARIEGLSHAEIAQRLGVSKSMVKQYVAKGYARCYAAAYGSAID